MSTTNAKTIRGLQSIRTRSGASDQATLSYHAYTKITYLEMEKCRRQKERDNLVARLKTLDERLRAIAVDQNALMRRVGMRSRRKTVASPSSSPNNKSPAPPAGRGFKLRY
ncbi:MAG: hypothetical protein M1608_15545 [Candidatus Omnitrophica bacterium]|nr:hypothetical protein [Candidatus Omnitrophota bacterium]